ncbi:hypothetical protein AOLI_G00310300 [Acnodon oligacanthus]
MVQLSSAVFDLLSAENKMTREMMMLATETLKDLLGIHQEDIEEEPEGEPLGGRAPCYTICHHVNLPQLQTL